MRARAWQRLPGVMLCLGALFSLLIQTQAAATPYFPRIQGTEITSLPLSPPPEKQSFLLVLVDTIRPDHLGAYGYDRPTSPFIDSLAREGVVFANHFSNSSWTKPSVASLFTGLLPRRHNVLPVTSRLSGSIPTLAQSFRQAGYRTGAVLGNNFGGRRYGLDRGFDRFADPSSHFGGKPPSAQQLLSHAARWIEEDKAEPFFYVVFLFDPHDPYTPPPTYRKMFCPDCTAPEVHSPLREYKGPGPTPRQLGDMRNLYDGEIRSMDDQLKEFYARLDKMGVASHLSTLLVGDHGEAFGEHNVFEHAFHLWDEVVRTPFILHSPRVKTPGIYRGLTQHADIFPTFLRLAEAPIPPGIQGQAVVHGEKETPLPQNRLVVTEVQMYGIHRASIRNLQHKLIHHTPLDELEYQTYYSDARVYPSVVLGHERRELYQVQRDPFERTDIYQIERARAIPLERVLETYFITGGLEEDATPVGPDEDTLRDLRSIGYIQ